jgi:DNA-binding NtrC family response regulator
MNDSPIVPAGEPVGPLLPSPRPAPRRILVVDDEEEIRHINTQVLIRHGYQVDTAEDGAMAWEALQAARYDLLLTDHNMPKVTGVELLKKLHGARMDVAVIMASGVIPHHEFEKCPWVQPASTLLKPYSLENLLSAVKEVLCETERPPEGPQSPPSCAP